MVLEDRPDHIHSKAIPALIAKLLTERQQMLVLFHRLVEMKPYTTMALVQPLLQQFCQVLMDYVALGHFEVFEGFEDNAGDAKGCRRVKHLARELYPRIAETTQAALDFNDRHDRKEQGVTANTLRESLSQLGEQLAVRIELEDRLISAIKSPAKEPIQ